MQVLQRAEIPFLIGGAFAFRVYTGISRDTKDFDLFVCRRDIERALDVFSENGYETEFTFPHWLGKIRSGEHLVDLIFAAGNGVCEVEESWFEHAHEADVFGVSAKLCPAEEMLWMKAFVMERERFDGADVNHLLHCCVEKLDWPRLVKRFEGHSAVLLSHLILFGYVYPGERDRIPAGILETLMKRSQSEGQAGEARLCQGTLLSRAQYLVDVEEWGYHDARLTGRSGMTPEDVDAWTNAIGRID